VDEEGIKANACPGRLVVIFHVLALRDILDDNQRLVIQQLHTLGS
jgi:hypothetical protein